MDEIRLLDVVVYYNFENENSHITLTLQTGARNETSSTPDPYKRCVLSKTFYIIHIRNALLQMSNLVSFTTSLTGYKRF